MRKSTVRKVGLRPRRWALASTKLLAKGRPQSPPQEWRLLLSLKRVIKRRDEVRGRAYGKGRAGHGNRRAIRITGADEDAHFELVVQAAAGTDAGKTSAGRRFLTPRPREALTRYADGGAAAVVADGDPLVIGKERIVGPEQPADGGGVVDGNIEVGVVPNLGGQ